MQMKKLNVLDWITLTLLVIGGLNWGLVAFGWNVVSMLGSSISMIIYCLVGVSALYVLIFTMRKLMSPMMPPMSSM